MTLTLCVVGGPNYAQFGNRVHVGRAYVRAEADHANGADNLLVGSGGLERRDEPGGVVSGVDSAARVKTGGRGTSRGEATSGEGKEQGTIRQFHICEISFNEAYDNMVAIWWCNNITS